MGLFDLGSDQTDLDTEALYGQNDAGAFTTPESNARAPMDAGTSWARGSNDVVLGGDWATQYHNNSLNIDPRDYMYGRTAGGADFAANRALNTGQSAQGTGENLLGNYTAAANAANARQAIGGNWSAQNATLGTSGMYGNQLASLEAQQGPSAAQAQLQSGTNQALSSQLALARSGRGFGGNAAAMGQAQTNAAGIQANQATSAAQLGAQENAAWRQRQAANLGNAAGIYQGIGQQQGQQIQSDVNSVYQNRAQNDQAALGYSQLGTNAYLQGTNANLAGQQLANQVRGTELVAGGNRESNALQQWAAVNRYNLSQQQRSDQQTAAGVNAAATIGAAAIAASDVRGKTNIVPDQGSPMIVPEQYRPGRAPDNFGKSVAFDGALYRPIESPFSVPEQYQPGSTAAQDAVRAAPGSFYDYKDPSAPGAAPGRHYGPMAQDLAATPAGRSAVVQSPDGRLGVDTGRLSLVNTGALSAQQKQLDAQAAELQRLRTALNPVGDARQSRLVRALGDRSESVFANETTRLSPEEEAQFRAWSQKQNVRDVDDPRSHYDYRGFWKENPNANVVGGRDHFPDTFKQHGHPTFSAESQYSQGADDGGSWTYEGGRDHFHPGSGTGIDLRGAGNYGWAYQDPRRDVAEQAAELVALRKAAEEFGASPSKAVYPKRTSEQ